MTTYRARLGTTLIEMLISLVIATMIMGILVMVHVASMRLWTTAAVNEETAPLGNIIVDRIGHDLTLSESFGTKPAQTYPASTSTPNEVVHDIYCVMLTSSPTVNSGVYSFNLSNSPVCPVAYGQHYYLTPSDTNTTTLHTLWYVQMDPTCSTNLTTPHAIATNVTSMTCWILDAPNITLPNSVKTASLVPAVQLSVTLQSTQTAANYASVNNTFYSFILLRNNNSTPLHIISPP